MTRDVNDVMHRKRARRIWGDLKKSVVENLTPNGKGRLSATNLCLTHVLWGSDGKVIIERLFISLLYVETFNTKVIKGFVPEQRCRYVFFVFRDSYVLCIYVMNILCTFPMFMYGYVTSRQIM